VKGLNPNDKIEDLYIESPPFHNRPGTLLTGKSAHFSGQCTPTFHIFYRNTGEIQ
jgi:hypothetical protein